LSSKAIAVDLGGTRIKIGITEGGGLISSTLIEAQSAGGIVARLPAVESEISGLLSHAGIALREVRGIGISIPGIVDSEQMRLLSVNAKFADAVGFDFAGWSRERWNLPLVIENDARSALIGEWQYGAGRGYNDLVMVTLGTGIGGAAIIGGQILRGKHFQAGILAGHLTVNVHGSECNCGNTGCVETEASSWRLPDLAARHPLFNSSALSRLERIDYKDLFDLAGKGDALAKELIDQSLDAWSSCVVNMIHAYDPELVILGGGIMRSESLILPAISSRVARHAWTSWGKVKVAAAEQKDFAALLGVSYLLSVEHNSK
jgi:glucokinase